MLRVVVFVFLLFARSTADVIVSTLAGGSGQYIDGPNNIAMFNGPNGVGVDASGNVYVADSSNGVVRKINATGYVSTLAGNGSYGYADGPGASAMFRVIYNVVSDAVGNVYVADALNSCVRKVTPTGVVSTLAGSGDGYADGPGITAKFRFPTSIAVDVNGTVYVADYSNSRVRKVAPDGTVSTLAGNGTYGYAVGPGASAMFKSPSGVAVDRYGNVYVADPDSNVIFKINSTGYVTNHAGSGVPGDLDGPASAARFQRPRFIDVDSVGNVYVSEPFSCLIRKINTTRYVSTYAGSSCGFFDGQGKNAQFSWPTGIRIDPSGNIYVADNGNNRIRKVNSTGYVSTVAGINNFCVDAQGSNARFNNINSVAVDSNGNVFVADTSNNKIRMVDPAGNVTTVAGDGNAGLLNDPAASAQFNNPTGVAVDSNGNAYIADASNCLIRLINTSGYVSTIAGSTCGFTDGQGTSAQFGTLYSIAHDWNGNIYVSDPDNYVVRKINATGYVTTIAGDGQSNTLDGQSVSAEFSGVNGITVDLSGNIYVSDATTCVIRMINTTGYVSTIAGDGSCGFADGQGLSAQFNQPYGLAVDFAGNIYVADEANNRIRVINTTQYVSTLGGDGNNAYIDGNGTTSQFASPFDIDVDYYGNVYVADTGNNLVRKIVQLNDTYTTTMRSTTRTTTVVSTTTTDPATTTTTTDPATTTTTTDPATNTTTTNPATTTTTNPATTTTTNPVITTTARATTTTTDPVTTTTTTNPVTTTTTDLATTTTSISTRLSSSTSITTSSCSTRLPSASTSDAVLWLSHSAASVGASMTATAIASTTPVSNVDSDTTRSSGSDSSTNTLALYIAIPVIAVVIAAIGAVLYTKFRRYGYVWYNPHSANARPPTVDRAARPLVAAAPIHDAQTQQM